MKKIVFFRGVKSWKMPDTLAAGLFIPACLFFLISPLHSYSMRLARMEKPLKARLLWVLDGMSWMERYPLHAAGALRKLDETQAALEIQRMARIAGLTLESIRPEGVHSSRGAWFLDESFFEVAGWGEEAAVFSFVHAMTKSPYAWRLHECILRPGSKEGQGVCGRWKIGVLRHIGRSPAVRRLAFRDIFQAGSEEDIPGTVRPLASPVFQKTLPVVPKSVHVGEDAAALVKDLLLVGVMDDGATLKAAVEDRRTNRSFLVQEGDLINELKVARIKDSEVVLEAQGSVYSLWM